VALGQPDSDYRDDPMILDTASRLICVNGVHRRHAIYRVLSQQWGRAGSNLIEGAPACAGYSRPRGKIPFVIVVAEMTGSLI
jgi:hypothetical protein